MTFIVEASSAPILTSRAIFGDPEDIFTLIYMKDQYKVGIGMLIVLALSISATGNKHLRIKSSPPVICSGGITLISQAQVNAFPSSHPCNEISGTLTISGNDITNLDSLHFVTRVDMDLNIINNPTLTSIAGLSSLTYVGAGGGSYPGIHITNNSNLTNLDGLNQLTSIKGALEISNNGQLTNLDGLGALSSIGSLFPSYQCLNISNNTILTSLRGLRSITSLPGPLNIQNNAALPNLDGLDSLDSINGYGGSLTVSGNTSLTNINGLSSLSYVFGKYGSVSIFDNPSLVNLNGLSALKKIDAGGPSASLSIKNNALLADVDGLSSLIEIGGAGHHLTVTGNLQMAKCCGLYNILSSPSMNCPYGCSYITISGNGTGCTKEEILASGPCCTSPDGCPATEPASQPTNLLFTNITINSMDVSFTAPAASPMGFITLMRSSSSPHPDDVPIDNTVYHLGEIIGNSKIVGLGSDTSFTVTNLNSSTVYYFDVFSYNSTNYLSTSPLGGSQSTASTEPTAQATNMIFSAVTDTTMTVSFTAAVPAPNGYITLMQAFGAPYPDDVPIDGTTYHTGDVIGSNTIVIDAGSEMSLDVIYLSPGVDYYFDVFSYNIINGVYDYLTVNPLEGNQRTSSSGSPSARRSADYTVKATAYSSKEISNTGPFPNPFSENITIPFTTNQENAFVQIAIYDFTGRKITDVVSQNFPPGYHEAKWLGTDNLGNKVSEGIYIYHIRTSESKEQTSGLLVAK